MPDAKSDAKTKDQTASTQGQGQGQGQGTLPAKGQPAQPAPDATVDGEQAKANEALEERANQAAERAPALDADLEEVQKGTDDPTSQRVPSRIHAMTTEYAGYINVGRPDRAKEVEEQLAREGYSVEGIRLADSPSLPQHVAEEENRRSPAERRKVAAEREEFVEATGRRVPEPSGRRAPKATTAEGDK